jgi:ATP-binding cassette, subfamily C, bacterial CydD
VSGALDRRLIRRSAHLRRHLTISLLLSLLTAGLIVAQAALLARVVVLGFDHDRLAAARPALIAALSVVLARSALQWCQRGMSTRTAAAVKAELRSDVMAAILGDRRGGADVSSGRLLALLAGGLDALDGYFGRYLPQLLLAAIVPVVGAVAIATADPTSAVVVAVTLPLIVFFMVLIGVLTRERTQRRWAATQRLGHHFADLVAGLPTLRVFGRTWGQVRGLIEVGERHRHESMAALRWAFLSAFVLELISTLSVALVAVSIGLRLVHAELDLRSALFVLLLVPEVYLPIRMVGMHFHDSAAGLAAATDAFATIDSALVPRVGAPVPTTRDLGVALDSVTVRYPDRPSRTLDGLSFRLAPGETVALTGPSGSGKSTTLGLLLGLVRPLSGRILVEGADLETLDLVAWRRQLAWVPQDPHLVGATVEQAVSLGSPGATPAEVRESIHWAGIDEIEPARDLRDQPLSAGERRRVALARALLRVLSGRARILLLDEPTAGLDERTEAALGDMLRRVRAGSGGAGSAQPPPAVSILLVTHRPAMMMLADRTISLGGPVVASLVTAPSASRLDAIGAGA